MIGIYKITSPSKIIYIGQTTNWENRHTKYRLLHCKEQPKLYNSFKKYGFENHKIEFIQECEISELNDLERYYQDLYNVVKEGLNCYLTKSSDRSGKHSEESIQKMRIVQSKRSIETIKKYIKTRTGCKVSEETKIKISNKLKGNKLSKVTKNKMSVSRTGIGNPKSKKVICTVTGKIYHSCAICEKENNMKFNSLCNKLNGTRTNNTNFIYL